MRDRLERVAQEIRCAGSCRLDIPLSGIGLKARSAKGMPRATRHSLFFCALFALFLCFSPLSAIAEEEAKDADTSDVEEEEQEVEAEEETDIPEALDIYERKAEMYRFEFSPYAGDLFGDKLHHSFVFGGGLDYRITPKISIGTDFFWTDIAYDSNSAFGRTVTDDDMYSIQGVLTFNIPAAYLSKKGVVETDLFTTVGGGILRINGSTRGDGFVGGGVKIFTGWAPWFGFRVEVRNYFSSIPTATGSKFSADVVMTFGPTFMLPPKMF